MGGHYSMMFGGIYAIAIVHSAVNVLTQCLQLQCKTADKISMYNRSEMMLRASDNLQVSPHETHIGDADCFATLGKLI